jgi:GT2 family glycosyltransferase
MKPEPISFTIVIATCNRPDRLRNVVRALDAAAQATDVPHTIAVIDNGSRAPAADVTDDLQRQFPTKIIYHRSTPLNKAVALNTGIGLARTDWLCFTDDDCLPDVGWLRAGQAFIAASRFPVFTGKIVSGSVPFKLPRWLPEGVTPELPWTPAFFDYPRQAESGALQPDQAVPYGANLFVRRDIFEKYGGYDELLWDRCGKAALGAEDAEFGIRLRKRGVPIGFCKEARVVHPVYPERTTLRYYLRHMYHAGLREPFFAETDRHASLAYLLKSMILSLLSLPFACLRGRPVKAMHVLMNAARDAGEIAGRRRLGKNGL